MNKTTYTVSNFRKVSGKFEKLQSKISNMMISGSFWDLKLFERNALLRKLKILFKRLQKFRMRTGVKIAGVALAYTLISNVSFSQPFVKSTGSDNPFASPENPFAGHLIGENMVGTLCIPTLADIDNDGDLDLISGHSTYQSNKQFEFNKEGIQKKELNKKSKGPYDYQIDCFENKGTASEPEFEKIDGTDNPFDGLSFPYMYFSQAVLTDIDGDGDLDLSVTALTSDYNNFIFQFFENNGTAEEPSYTEITGTDNPLDGIQFNDFFNHKFDDIDGDGDLDLILGIYSTVMYYENTGDANNPAFTLVPDTANPFYGMEAEGSYTELVDIDGDGDLDLFLLGDPVTKFDFLQFFENTGTNTAAVFQQAVGPFNAFDNYMAWGTTEFADIDNDGDYDAVFDFISYQTYYYGADPLYYYRNDGNANSPDFKEITDPQVSYLSRPDMADIDNDGDLDMIVGGYYNELLFLENLGTANNPEFVINTETSSPFYDLPYFGYALYPKFVDLDNDGDYDLVFSSYLIKSGMTYYENIGDAENPEFELATDNPLSAVNSYGTFGGDIDFVDIDGDGDFDIFAQADANYITMFENIGDAENPEFAVELSDNPFYGTYISQIMSFDFIDFDDDGDIDMVLSEGGIYNFQLSYYENAGDNENPIFDKQIGTNNPFNDIEDPGHWPYPSLADLDNDSDIDLVLGDYYGELAYYENFFVPPVSVNKINSEINIYPNPSDAMFFVKMNNIQNIKVWNVSGQMLLNENVNTDKYMLDLSAKPKGLYLLKVFAGGEEYTHKVILK